MVTVQSEGRARPTPHPSLPFIAGLTALVGVLPRVLRQFLYPAGVVIPDEILAQAGLTGFTHRATETLLLVLAAIGAYGLFRVRPSGWWAAAGFYFWGIAQACIRAVAASRGVLLDPTDPYPLQGRLAWCGAVLVYDGIILGFLFRERVFSAYFPFWPNRRRALAYIATAYCVWVGISSAVFLLSRAG